MEKENSYKDAAQHYEQVTTTNIEQKCKCYVEMKIRYNPSFFRHQYSLPIKILGMEV